jgi:hypothetical protein
MSRSGLAYTRGLQVFVPLISPKHSPVSHPESTHPQLGQKEMIPHFRFHCGFVKYGYEPSPYLKVGACTKHYAGNVDSPRLVNLFSNQEIQ